MGYGRKCTRPKRRRWRKKNLPAERTRGDVRDTEYILFLGGNNLVQKIIPYPALMSPTKISGENAAPPIFRTARQHYYDDGGSQSFTMSGLEGFFGWMCPREPACHCRNREGGGGLKKIFCSSRRFFLSFFFVLRLFPPSCTFRRFGTRRRKKRTSQRGNKSRSKIFILYAKARAWMLFSPLLPSISSSNGRMVKMCPPSSLSHTHGRSIRSHILGRQIWGKSPTDRLAEYYISPPLPSSKNGEIRGQFVFPGRVGRSKVPCCGSISFSEHGETRCFPTEEGSSSRFVIRLSQSTQNIYLPRQQPF